LALFESREPLREHAAVSGYDHKQSRKKNAENYLDHFEHLHWSPT
jgi:hypothetical protein